MPELITINYFTDLLHFFMYLIIIYYMLYNVVWNKLRTLYYVMLSKTLNKKKITLNFLYFTINYIYSLMSTSTNKSILLATNILAIQQKALNYSITTKYYDIIKYDRIMSLFYIQNPYYNNINPDIKSKVETNKYINSIY